jgi:calcineurin-like phosphoesterase family protein
MQKVLKFDSDTEGVYFSSDWHVYHKRPWVLEDVGYSSVEERARDIRDSVNNTVGCDGTLFYLGDGFLNSTPEMAVNFLSSLTCKKIFYIWGNHESPLSRLYRQDMNKIATEFLLCQHMEIYPWSLVDLPRVSFVGNYQRILMTHKPSPTEKKVSKSVVMCHYPMDVFDHQSHNGFMLCGHSHYNFERTRADYKLGKRLDVGWDGHKKILSWPEIKTIMSKKDFLPEDHHN